MFEKQEIREYIRKRLSEKKFQVEFLDVINLKYFDRLDYTQDLSDNECVFRFLFYRSIARPVHRPLLQSYQNRFDDFPELKTSFSEHASRILESYLNTNSHRYSFNKYNERIMNRGIHIPEEFLAELRQYLDNAPK
jgi:hypothetical protein